MNDDNLNDALRDDDVEVQKKMMTLDWDIEPGRDLWEGIVAKMDACSEVKTVKMTVFGWVPYALAASFLMAFVSLLFGYLNLDQSREQEAMLTAFVLYQQSQIELIEQQHQMVRKQFVGLLDDKRGQLPPEFVVEVEIVLQTIDAAASELKLAIIAQPYDPSYSLMLLNAYQQEMKLLNKIKFNQDVSI